MIEIDFTKKLLEWNRNENKRSMPWKGETDPYRIWLSEIILQQTRVEQGLAYYNKFIRLYPDVFSLANASEREIFKSWEGLGYYTRCRNLILSAKKIAFELNGIFPSEYSEIISLPGIGGYTAAAISSFAFGLPYAVVDGNVERVLSRYFGIATPTGSASSKRFYTDLASAVLDKKNPGLYNQAIMDFGATICKPRNPQCMICSLAENCQAFQYQWTEKLPPKNQQIPKRTRWLNYFIIHDKSGKIWIRERRENDIWRNLYEFVLWESGQIIPHNWANTKSIMQKTFGNTRFHILYISPVFTQMLTHQTIKGCFIHVMLDKFSMKPRGLFSVSFANLSNYPFPKLIRDYIKFLSVRS
jgi:A/G-specific adenine glycosylase